MNKLNSVSKSQFFISLIVLVIKEHMSKRSRVITLCNRGFNKSRKTLAKYAVVHNKENELEIEKTSVNTSPKLKPMDIFNDFFKKQENFTCNSCKQAMSKR